MFKRFFIAFNCFILMGSVLFYLNAQKAFKELKSSYGEIESGFDAINSSYLDSLKSTNEYFQLAFNAAALRKIKNDTVWSFMAKQRHFGQYYLDYQAGIQNEIFEIETGITNQNSNTAVLLSIIVVACLTNIILVSIFYKPVAN